MFCRGAVAYCATQQPLDAAVRAGYLAPYDSWRNRIAVLRFVQDIPLQPGDPSYRVVSEVEERLPLLRDVPMIICWGEKDFVFDGDFLDEWKRRFPQAEVMFPRAGHFVLEDAGNEILRSQHSCGHIRSEGIIVCSRFCKVSPQRRCVGCEC